MNWGVGDFQFLKSGSDEPCIQPIESSQLGIFTRCLEEEVLLSYSAIQEPL
ncbi:hypothetical protein [Bordetella pertussis]|uniref:hypothetical protein n=1 Tax=Bordetella pertussis TaxID=520 RepID=UPI0028E47453|nr:hypothetical protein [Bordetella pertussis]WNQ35721.1 hypothetical protein PVZ86_07055 [Bordetella pertussis]WNQ65211.1 hypothetical protein PVZ94_07095 [Bordetella pertussis]